MRKMARGRVRCLVGLAVAVGLVTLLSPLPFTSSTPRLKGGSAARHHPAPNLFNPTEAAGEDLVGSRGMAGENREAAGDCNENSGGNHEKIDGKDELVVNIENLGKDDANVGANRKIKDENDENIGENMKHLGGNPEKAGGNKKNINKIGNSGEKKVKSSVNKESTGINGEGKQLSGKSPVEEEVERRVEEEVEVKQEELELSHDSYIQNIPPKEWVEVKKIKPKEGGGGGGGRGRGKKTKKQKKTSAKKSHERPVGLSPKQLRERAASLPGSSPVCKFLEEQSRRVAHVAKMCRSFMPSLADVVAGSRGPPAGLLSVRDIIYDRKNQLTFCPVYKAASTSWTITLLELAGYWSSYTKTQPLQKVVKAFYPKLTGLGAASITANTTHFMVVRHPLERLLSCYRDKFQLASKDYYYHLFGEKMVRRYREALKHISNEKVKVLQEEVRLALIRQRGEFGEEAGNKDLLRLPNNPFANPVGPTFPEFAEYVATTKYDDEHWRTYSTHCAPCTLTYDFVLRFESLQEETKWFLEYLNRTGEVTPRWDNHNSKAETGEVFCQYYSQLSLELIDRLVEKYKKDIIMYEYDVEAYRKCAKDYPSSISDGEGVTTTSTTTAAADNNSILLVDLKT